MQSPQKKNERRVSFLADRMAFLIVDLVKRDCDYGEFCHDEFYEGVDADQIRETQKYKVALDFIRGMMRRQDNENKDVG